MTRKRRSGGPCVCLANAASAISQLVTSGGTCSAQSPGGLWGGAIPALLSGCAAHPSSSYLPYFRPGAIVVICPSPYHHVPQIVLTFLIVGTLSVNASNVPVARNPAPEWGCESSRSFSAVSHHNTTSVSFDSSVTMEQGPRASLSTPNPRYPCWHCEPGPPIQRPNRIGRTLPPGPNPATGCHHLGVR